MDVTVTTPGGTSATTGTGNDYTYVRRPHRHRPQPDLRHHRRRHRRDHHRHQPHRGHRVSFGGTAATSFTAVNATTITCTSPAHAAGAVDVTVTTSGGTSDLR